MTTQDMEILIHQLVGGWAIEHRMWMTDAALTEIERRIALAIDAVANPKMRPLCSFCGNQVGEPFVTKRYPSIGDNTHWCTGCFVRHHRAHLD